MDQKEFFARVLPSGNHYIAFPGKVLDDGRLVWFHKSFTELYQGVQQAQSTTGKDVYFAVASYKDAQRPDPKRPGKTRAYRKQENVEALKCLFIDVDFKAYGGSPEATFDAVKAFLAKSQIQKPTIIVSTGGGFHLYWTFPKAISLREWQPLANGLAGLAENCGLLADLQCTIDSARILRVPETFNRKYDPPQWCKVQSERPDDINMDEMARLLTAVVPLRLRRDKRARADAGQTFAVDPEVAEMFAGSSTADLGEEASFSQNRFVRVIATECGVIGDMLDRGGNGDSRDLWNNMLLLMAYTRDGREYAHLLSKNDPRYTPEETDRELDMKVADSANLGPTTCMTFNRLSPKCQACSHFGKIRSPIQLGVEPEPEPEVVRRDLPTHCNGGNTYKRCKKGDEIYYELFIEGAEMDTPVLLTDALGNNIMQVTIRGKHGTNKIELLCEQIPEPRYLPRAFSKRLYGVNQKLLGEAMTSWMNLLRQADGEAPRQGAFGWSESGGFAVSGILYDSDGTSKVVSTVRDNIAKNYTVKGELQPWKVLVDRMLTDPRPELQIVLATAFAAPLLQMTDLKSTAVVIRSPQSGVGKSSSMRAARAVWGTPADMSHASDTPLAVEERLATLTNMPWYWDELKIQDARAVSNTIHQIIQGRSKERSTPIGDTRPTHVTHGMLVIATNASISEMMQDASQGTDAGIYRVLELDLPPRVDRAADIEFNRLMRGINNNYGHAGIAYAKQLAMIYPKLEKLIDDIARNLQGTYKPTEPERFWMASIYAILGGAIIAKQMGLVDFDIPRMNTCLLKILKKARGNDNTNDTPDVLASRIYGFFHTRSFVTDRFDFIPLPGMPRPVTTHHQPLPNAAAARVRLAVNQDELVISQEGVREYAKATQQQAHLLLEKMRRMAGCRVERTNLDKGISATQGAKMGREQVFVIPASTVIGQDEIQKWATSAAGHSAASPGSSSGIAPKGSTTP